MKPLRLSITDVESWVDEDLGTSDWREMTQQRIDLFAQATEDEQWIHTDPLAAAQGPYEGTIAHGFLTLSMLPALTADIYEVEGVTAAINHRVEDVRFRAPVPAGSRLRASAKLTRVRRRPRGYVEVTVSVSMRLEDNTLVCTANQVTLYLSETPTGPTRTPTK